MFRYIFLYYYFGQWLESNQLVIISPFHVKIYENCEMFETIEIHWKGSEAWHQALLKPTVLHLDSQLSQPQRAY